MYMVNFIEVSQYLHNNKVRLDPGFPDLLLARACGIVGTGFEPGLAHLTPPNEMQEVRGNIFATAQAIRGLEGMSMSAKAPLKAALGKLINAETTEMLRLGLAKNNLDATGQIFSFNVLRGDLPDLPLFDETNKSGSVTFEILPLSCLQGVGTYIAEAFSRKGTIKMGLSNELVPNDLKVTALSFAFARVADTFNMIKEQGASVDESLIREAQRVAATLPSLPIVKA